MRINEACMRLSSSESLAQNYLVIQLEIFSSISLTQDTKPTAQSSSEWFVNGNTPLHFTQIAFLAIYL